MVCGVRGEENFRGLQVKMGKKFTIFSQRRGNKRGRIELMFTLRVKGRRRVKHLLVLGERDKERERERKRERDGWKGASLGN